MKTTLLLLAVAIVTIIACSKENQLDTKTGQLAFSTDSIPNPGDSTYWPPVDTTPTDTLYRRSGK